jgi:intein-encoded DNA endonuclease-like protein
MMGTRRKIRHRTLEERLALFSHVRQLTSEGLPPRDVATAIGISLDDVCYWLRVKQPSRERYVPDLTPRPELSYLIGAYLGDGQTAGEADKKVRFKVADLDFAKILNEAVSRVLGTGPKAIRIERGFHCVVYDSAVLYDFLQQPIEPLIPYAETSPESFLRGFFDAEGYVSAQLNHSKKTLNSILVGAANCNLEYLGLARRLLENLAIFSQLRTTNKAGQEMKIREKVYVRRRDVHHIVTTKADEIRMFQGDIGFFIPKKREKLNDLVKLLDWQDPRARYEWFTKNYVRIGHNWVKKTKETPGEPVDYIA